MRDLFLAPRVMQKTLGATTPRSSRPPPRSCGSPRTRPTSSCIHGAHDTLVPVDQARQFVARLREVSKRTVVYAELPGAQHAFDVFPSIRSAHIVRAIDRYLHWHWNTWRRERLPTQDSHAGTPAENGLSRCHAGQGGGVWPPRHGKSLGSAA